MCSLVDARAFFAASVSFASFWASLKCSRSARSAAVDRAVEVSAACRCCVRAARRSTTSSSPKMDVCMVVSRFNGPRTGDPGGGAGATSTASSSSSASEPSVAEPSVASASPSSFEDSSSSSTFCCKMLRYATETKRSDTLASPPPSDRPAQTATLTWPKGRNDVFGVPSSSSYARRAATSKWSVRGAPRQRRTPEKAQQMQRPRSGSAPAFSAGKKTQSATKTIRQSAVCAGLDQRMRAS
mmetsp:Transcript_27359/g.91987  ORF Transcript_27359/g.91987 Transcript_27359/m.91987 type:complete len:241 (+) Transcript_27359:328-1050(+)